MSKVNFIRYFFTLSLLYGVYTETGVYTTLCLFLGVFGVEFNLYRARKSNKEQG